MRPLLSLLLLPPLLTSPAGSRGRALSERFLRVSSERLAFREWQSPAVSVVSGEFRNLPRQVRFVKKSVVRVFRPFGHSPPRCHSDIYRGHCGARRTFLQDQLTIYPPSTHLGLEWAPTNPIGCLGLYWVVLAISQSVRPAGRYRPTAVGLSSSERSSIERVQT